MLSTMRSAPKLSTKRNTPGGGGGGGGKRKLEFGLDWFRSVWILVEGHVKRRDLPPVCGGNPSPKTDPISPSNGLSCRSMFDVERMIEIG